MSEVENMSEKMDEHRIETSVASAAEQTNTNEPVDIAMERGEEDPGDKVQNETKDQETTESANIESDEAEMPDAEEVESLKALESIEDLLLEDPEPKPEMPVTLPQITAVEHVEGFEKFESGDQTEAIKIDSPKESPKMLSEESSESSSEAQNNAPEISLMDSNDVDVSENLETKNVTQSIEDEDSHKGSAPVASEESSEAALDKLNNEPEISAMELTEFNEENPSLTKEIDKESAEVEFKKSSENTSDMFNNEPETSLMESNEENLSLIKKSNEGSAQIEYEESSKANLEKNNSGTELPLIQSTENPSLNKDKNNTEVSAKEPNSESILNKELENFPTISTESNEENLSLNKESDEVSIIESGNKVREQTSHTLEFPKEEAKCLISQSQDSSKKEAEVSVQTSNTSQKVENAGNSVKQIMNISQTVNENIEYTKSSKVETVEEEKNLNEPMDTYDSQESITLVIDETSNTTEHKDDTSEATKNRMEVDQIEDYNEEKAIKTRISTELVIDPKDSAKVIENPTSEEKVPKESLKLTAEVLQEEKQITDHKKDTKNEENQNTENNKVEDIITIDISNDKDSSTTEKSKKEDIVTVKQPKEDTQTTETLKEDTETIEKPKMEVSLNVEKTKEHYSPNKSKDDDVIPVELPPIPIIEIDDEDDIEDTTATTANETSTKIETKEPETAMEIEEKLPETNKEKDSIISTDIEMTDKESDTSKTKEASQKESNVESTESLLEISAEKSLEDFSKPEITKESEEVLEDTTDEVFYKKECINYECPRKHKQYFKVPQFAFSYFKVTKKKFKIQYICADCYDKSLEMYEEFCGLINAKQPLLMEDIPTARQEFVEIIDSSDDENVSEKAKPSETAKSAFSKNDLSLIEMELNNTIKYVLNRVEIQNQLTWSKTILSERLKRLEMETDYVDSELKSLQRKADKMHEGLYSCPKIKIRQLQPLDLNSGKVMAFDTQIQKEVQQLPPVGEIERPAIKLNSMYYAVKNNAIASWVPCKVIEQVEGGVTAQKNVKHYRIKFVKTQVPIPKTVPAKYLAYYDPPTVRLPIGTRVIAYFDATSLARGREKINVQSAFYPGIIAEPLKPNNKFRYLIFYDDGYTQYVYHKDVRLVCHVSECVWEDVHPASRDFIQKYLTQYSINRPMVQTQKGQSMNTESNGYWLHARVVDIDCSLVLMQFEGSKSHTEWIYRGSLRLGPVFKEYQKTLQKNSNMPVSRLPRRTEPFIRYTEDEESSPQQQPDKTTESNRAVARKTFGRPDSMLNSAQPSQQQQPQTNLPAVKHLNNSTIYVEDENKPKGKVVFYTAKRNLPPRKYKPHKCSPSCLFAITHNLSAYSPLSKPLLSGWERFIIRQKIKKVVTYRAPCGKIMRHMKELHHFLRVSNNVLTVDNFDFSHETNCLAEYVIESAIVQKRDISNGQEKMAIPLVNYYDNTLPPECKYSAKVIPTEGVHINTDPEFLVGCDCDDDCADKTKCACWQLTLTGAKYGNPNAVPEEVGYQYRRLLDHVPTGIYECNSNCKCKSSCLNRVVQNSLTMKLQVFKTSNRGWGLRCINDIPRGCFVCVYAGHLLTEAKANEGGQDAGDEYFAELDYIEVAEQIKEGYESEVEIPDAEEEEPYNPEGEDDEFTPSRSFLTRSKQKQYATKSTRNPEEDSQERQVINFNPNADMNEDSVRENSIRKLYGINEACYVMDAKISGNLGRYFNHSCAPNMFVQNVFVDTHDLRFPHVAFFSSSNIRAGTELTWNYNYEVGVVPGKVLYCQCGAANCRLRLL